MEAERARPALVGVLRLSEVAAEAAGQRQQGQAVPDEQVVGGADVDQLADQLELTAKIES